MFINDVFASGGPAGGDPSKWKSTKIGNHVSIGSNATIMPVDICDNVVVGAGSVVTKDILPANTNQAIAIIRPNQVDSNFLKLLMKSALIQNDTRSNVVQAVQANLSLGIIKATKFIKPSITILSLFKSTLSEVFENVNLYTEETQELTNLRDTLLPKLITGELNINDLD
jgi:restriction endonuclease S subunit